MIQVTLGIHIETALYHDNYAASPFFVAYLKRVWSEICEVIAHLLNKQHTSLPETQLSEALNFSNNQIPDRIYGDYTNAFNDAPLHLQNEIRYARVKSPLPEQQGLLGDASVVSDTTVTTKDSEISEDELVDYLLNTGKEALGTQQIFRIGPDKKHTTIPQTKHKG